MNLNTPLWQLTVGEFIDLQNRCWKQENEKSATANTVHDEVRFVYGINGLAELLNCSKATAQKIKNSGVIDRAVSQFGRKIMINAGLALELIQNNKDK